MAEKLLCCNCGVEFWMTDQLYLSRKRDHDSFYCPNGHGQHFTGKTREEKRIEELEREERRLEGVIRDLQKDAYDRRFKCPIAHCQYASDQKKRLRVHLEKFHKTIFASKLLPAKGTGVHRGNMGIENKAN